MRRPWRKVVLGAALTLTAALGVWAATAAEAQTSVESGSFSVAGDPGEVITGGSSYAFSTAQGESFSLLNAVDAGRDAAQMNSQLTISVRLSNGDSWQVTLDAPGTEPLQPGTYDNAVRVLWNGSTLPGLELTGNYRGCFTLTGTFTVLKAVFGPNGYVQNFDATFEQHCDGAEAAARGEVHITNPPPPAPPARLDLQLAVDKVDTVGVDAYVQGTVTCNKAATVDLTGSVTQVVNKEPISGAYYNQVECRPGEKVPWIAAAPPPATTSFGKGKIKVNANAAGWDQDYYETVTVSTTATLMVKKTKP